MFWCMHVELPSSFVVALHIITALWVVRGSFVVCLLGCCRFTASRAWSSLIGHASVAACLFRGLRAYLLK